MKYSRNDFSFLKSSWTLRYLHGKTVKPNSENDLYNLICNGPRSIFSLLDRKEYAQAANRIPYILTLLLDELFNIDYDLQEKFYQQQKDRTKGWETWNDLKISDKLEKLPWLDTYFGRQNIQKLFNDGKNSSHNTDEQNIAAITELLNFIGGLYNIYEAGPDDKAQVPVKGPSRTNLKSKWRQKEGPYYQDNSQRFQKNPIYKPRRYKKHLQKSVPKYQSASLDSVNDRLNEIWEFYATKQYSYTLNPIRIITEDLLKRALLKDNNQYNVEKYKLSKCIDLFEQEISNQTKSEIIDKNLNLLREVGNSGSHSGSNTSLKQEDMDNILNSLAYIMNVMSDKYGGDFTQIYNFNDKLDKQNRSKERVVYRNVTHYVKQPTTPKPVHQNVNREEIRKSKSNKNKIRKWVYLVVGIAIILIVVNRVINHNNQDNGAASEHASRVIHKTHHKKTKPHPVKKESQSSSSKQSQSSSSSNETPKPKVSKWVGLYKENDDGDDATLKINEDGSVIFTTNDDDNGVGRATGYWINKGSISSKIYLTHFDNENSYEKDDMPLTVTMSAGKQKIYVKTHDDIDSPDEYVRWEERQHYNLTNNKWVGTYTGTDSGDDKVTIKIKSDGSVIYTQDDEDNGVGKASGYWIDDHDNIHLYLTHLDNMDGVDESNMPLIVTMSDDQDRISVNSHSSDWTVDHYHRK